MKTIFGANVHHFYGLWLIGIGGAPTLAIKLWLKNHIFTFSNSSLKPPADDTSYYTRSFPKPKPSLFVKIIMKFLQDVFAEL